MSLVSHFYGLMLEALQAGRKAGLSPEQIAAELIDKTYPHAKRRGYPYKAWLVARREFCAAHGLPRRTSRPPAPDLLGEWKAEPVKKSNARPWLVLRAFGCAVSVKGAVHIDNLQPSAEVVGRFKTEEDARAVVDFDKETAKEVARFIATRRAQLWELMHKLGGVKDREPT